MMGYVLPIYLLRRFLGSVLLVFAATYLVIMLGDMLELSREATRRSVEAPIAIMALLHTPSIMNQGLPFVFLIGSLAAPDAYAERAAPAAPASQRPDDVGSGRYEQGHLPAADTTPIEPVAREPARRPSKTTRAARTAADVRPRRPAPQPKAASAWPFGGGGGQTYSWPGDR